MLSVVSINHKLVLKKWGETTRKTQHYRFKEYGLGQLKMLQEVMCNATTKEK